MDAGVDGIVIGCLTPDAHVDRARLTHLMTLISTHTRTTSTTPPTTATPTKEPQTITSPPLTSSVRVSVTFHRAIDMTRDPVAELPILVICGVTRVLTSGGASDVIAGIPTIKVFTHNHITTAVSTVSESCGL